MEESVKTPSLTAVDRIADGNGLQMIKAAIPYLPSRIQKTFSLYVKFLEINNVLSYYNNHVSTCSMASEQAAPDEILTELRNYGTEEQRQSMDQALNLIHTLKMYQECKELL